MINAIVEDASFDVAEAISERYQAPRISPETARAFGEYGIVMLPQFWSPKFFAEMCGAIRRAQPYARCKDFYMSEFKSPRRMSVLGGRDLRRLANGIWQLHRSELLRRTVSQIVGREIFPCGHEDECVVLNILQGSGQTHGWHLDDPTFAFVTIIRAPNCGGGQLELRSPEPSAARPCRSFEFRPNDAYVLRADSWLHRVAPLNGRDSERISLNIAFDSVAERVYGDTASKLYSS